MPTTAQIAQEINVTRPATYAAAKAAGDDGAMAAILNGPGVGGITVWRPALRAADILACVVWADVAAFTAAQWSALNVMLVPGTIDATIPRVRAFFGGLFAATTTLTNMTAAAQVAAPTRSEELWGAGAAVSVFEIAHAMGRG